MTTRVLIVDDSAFARKVLREVLQGAPNIEVVGTARDGLDALTKIEELDPDVMTLDLMMPNLDGIETLRALAGRERPKVVVVCMADSDSDLALYALAEGAVDIVHKPTALATDRLYELAKELIFKVESAALARPGSRAPSTAPSPLATASQYQNSRDVVLIGASTGGPQAIERILKALPADFPAPIAVVVHLPVGFTQSYAERLNADCPLRVMEAKDGVRLVTGQVVIARGGSHLILERDEQGLLGKLSQQPRSLHCPAVDQLFISAARVAGERALGVVLTGMGDDGLAGSRALHSQGARIIVESEASCVVYGMPRVVWEARLAQDQEPLPNIAATILKLV
jgi:two-component system, chemotaxis family, protein-glutamate methylesterase/glutaminase